MSVLWGEDKPAAELPTTWAHTVNLHSLPTGGSLALHRTEAALAAAGMVSGIGDARFGQCVIEQLNRLMPLCWWTAYRWLDDAPPQLRLTGCLGAEDCTRIAFGAYRDGLYLHDRLLGRMRDELGDSLRDTPSGQAVPARALMGHAHARELSAEHRRRIYSRHGLSERLSLAQGADGGGLLMINLYRHERQPAFCDDERDALQQIGPVLLAVVSRHLALVAPAHLAGGMAPGDNLARTQAQTQAPTQVHPQADTSANPSPGDCALAGLTRREREVCDRLLRGWTHDGIAVDLKLATTTVKTYRDRAFDRLGIHHRNELFALVLAQAQAGV